MQRTFLRSDTEDIIRLQQYCRSTISTRSSKNVNLSSEFVKKLIEELESASRQCRKLINQNQQIEEVLKNTKRELVSASEHIERLIVENKELAAKVNQQEQQQQTPLRAPQKPKRQNIRMLNSPTHQQPSLDSVVAAIDNDNEGNGTTTAAAGVIDGSVAVTNRGGRKRSAEKRRNDSAEEDQQLFANAAKRSLVGKASAEQQQRQQGLPRRILTSVDENAESMVEQFVADRGAHSSSLRSQFFEEQQHQLQYFTAASSASTTIDKLSSRRSISAPPKPPPTTTSIGMTPTSSVSSARPRMMALVSSSKCMMNNSRLAALRGSRISSSHGDLSRMVAENEEDDDYAAPAGGFTGPWLFAEQAVHSFQTKRNFLRIHCDRCETAIRFGILYVKCDRCKATFHEACRKQAPLPCVIRKHTPKPTGTAKRGRPRLGDLCPDTRPMVPPLITYCTYHLDSCGAAAFEPELYQADGNAAEVEAITKLVQSNKTLPKLENFQPLNIAGCVRKFLCQIREPVIPYSYGKEICGLLLLAEEDEEADEAKLQQRQDRLTNIVEDLPVAHMDTLGHLCRHWNRLIANSNGHLSTELFAVMMGPLVLGSARADAPLAHQACTRAMALLLQLGNEFWSAVSVSPPTSRSATATYYHSGSTPLSRNPSQRSKTGGGGTTPSTQQQPAQPQRVVNLDATANNTTVNN